MTLFRNVLPLANLLEELVSQFTMFGLLAVTFEEQMELPMELSPCYVFSMILHATLIRVEAREKVSSIS